MRRVGYIREKNDIKFLILYVMTHLSEPVTLSSLADMSMVDGGFDYFEFADAVAELVTSGHIRMEELPGECMYTITFKGRTTAEVFEKELPTPVREAAKRSAARVSRAISRDAALKTEIVTRRDGTRGVRLAFMDDDVPVFAFELMVLDDEQANLYIRNFRNHAEDMYSEFLKVLLDDYEEPDEFMKALMARQAQRAEEIAMLESNALSEVQA